MILPEEIEKQQFEVSFRGYNTREVDEFLSKIHSDLEEMIKEQEALKRKIAAAELIAKDSKEHEEEFIASMQNDRDEADSILANAKTEGERIIREAKNAASGIMAEVRRRAGDISAESKRSSADIIEAAHREADDIRRSAKEATEKLAAAAKAAAEKKLYSAKTEAENILAAAYTESRAAIDDAEKKSAAMTKKATETASVYENYINEIRSAAQKLCFEIDAELKNSASRIALLGKRISSSEFPEMPAEAASDTDDVKTYTRRSATEADIEKPSAPAIEEEPEIIVSDDVAESTSSNDGYFTEEYKLVMSELFGDDTDKNDASSKSSFEDDDTYDFIEKTFASSSEDEEPEDSGDTVTSEYIGITSTGKGKSSFDILFDDDALDRIYKSPSQEDINDILNN